MSSSTKYQHVSDRHTDQL